MHYYSTLKTKFSNYKNDLWLIQVCNLVKKDVDLSTLMVGKLPVSNISTNIDTNAKLHTLHIQQINANVIDKEQKQFSMCKQ